MNFDFLKPFPDLKTLYGFCSDAEAFVFTKPSLCAVSARNAMEFVVKLIYRSLYGGDYGLTVFDMVSDDLFVGFINNQSFINSIHFVRKLGNVASHGGQINQSESQAIIEELHFIVGEFCIHLDIVKDYPKFVKPVKAAPAQVPTPSSASVPASNSSVAPAKTPVVPASPHAKSEPVSPEKVEVSPELVAKFGPRMRETTFNVKYKRDENQNKKLYLAACLREAGWPIVSQPNQAMPCSAGINMILDDGDQVDYILYGRDNRPLAVVDFTTTNDNLIAGRTKGIATANKIAAKIGYKPIVYYTNGYYIFIIDQLGYNPRRVFQFHSIEELELLKMRATMRQDISAPSIDDNITNREYQKEAIRAACNAFMQKRRHSLLVMATGTGKTRVSISLVDILMKANWVKNVLFLADRTSLVRQAHKNFNKLLPSVTTSIYSGGSIQRDPNARIIFSTYQTMINLIDDDTREFSIGRFDLIIVDEAHRSIFKKYKSLFRYFDSLMIGLTATPRSEDNKSTYEMFNLPDGQPDYAYELEQAIKDGYLVGFSVLDKTTDVLRRGVHYDELSEEEKRLFEDAFATGDEEEKVDYTGVVFSGAKMKKEAFKKGSGRVVNLGTIDAMLNDLMKNGLKINGGDKIGKTIIFADSHFQAEKIVERFQTLYSYLGMDFCKLIDSQIADNQGLIDSFGERDKLPQVAVSVDMMDTGIDVPDVLNLVFFKGVYSKIKFLQMIGRGTRLSQDVFGPTLDKRGFLIFDYFDNFDYFRTRYTWTVSNPNEKERGFSVIPQSQNINERRFRILRRLNARDDLTPFEEQYREELRDFFVNSVRGLCNDDIEVQLNMAYVNKYRTAERWQKFVHMDKVDDILEHIIPLLPPDPDPMKVKTFDLMMYIIEDEVPLRITVNKDISRIRFGFGNVFNKMRDMLDELTKLKTIPAIVEKEAFIEKMKNPDYLLIDFSLEKCESARKELRSLMQYIPDDVKYYVINTKDFIVDFDTDGGVPGNTSTYPERAREFLNSNTPVLAKIRNLDELSKEEKQELEDTFKIKLGTEADYAAWSGNKSLLPYVRTQVGIDDRAITTKFGSFLNPELLNEQQLTFMNQIISYARENGDITFMDLQKVSPFCDVDIMNLFGDKIVYIKTLVNGLHRPVM